MQNRNMFTPETYVPSVTPHPRHCAYIKEPIMSDQHHPHSGPASRDPSHQSPVPRSGAWKRGAIAVAILAVIGYGASRYFDGKPQAPQNGAPPAVTVAGPLEKTVTEWDDYVGRFVASQSVMVKPRVSGQIVARRFKDGDMVKQGDALFLIDARPYKAAEAEARAGLASAQSNAQLARADLRRADALTGENALSENELDRLRAQVRAADAAAAGAQAQLTQRSLELEWTTVVAPISGRVSDRRVDVGNLVMGGAGDAATLLTTIQAADPIYFSFDASEALYLKAKRDAAEGNAVPRVQVRLQDEGSYAWEGAIDFTDNALDPRSGTIRGRATIANPDGFLSPGMFGNMRLANGGQVKALLVPDAAVQTDLARKIVLTVGKDNKVTATPVQLGALVDGLRIIRGGLSPSDQVIIAGMQFAAPGSVVSPQKGEVKAKPAQAMAPIAPAAAQATLER